MDALRTTEKATYNTEGKNNISALRSTRQGSMVLFGRLSLTFSIYHPVKFDVGLNEWVIGPLEKRLALAPSAGEITRLTVGANLACMPGKCLPSLDLNLIDLA